MTVFMFPGQGAQKPGMGADLLGIAEVAQTFAIAGEVCGVDVAALAREGSAEQVNDAYNAQVLAAALSVGRSMPEGFKWKLCSDFPWVRSAPLWQAAF